MERKLATILLLLSASSVYSADLPILSDVLRVDTANRTDSGNSEDSTMVRIDGKLYFIYLDLGQDASDGLDDHPAVRSLDLDTLAFDGDAAIIDTTGVTHGYHFGPTILRDGSGAIHALYSKEDTWGDLVGTNWIPPQQRILPDFFAPAGWAAPAVGLYSRVGHSSSNTKSISAIDIMGVHDPATSMTHFVGQYTFRARSIDCATRRGLSRGYYRISADGDYDGPYILVNATNDQPSCMTCIGGNVFVKGDIVLGKETTGTRSLHLIWNIRNTFYWPNKCPSNADPCAYWDTCLSGSRVSCDPIACEPSPNFQQYNYDLYYAKSTDGGTTWTTFGGTDAHTIVDATSCGPDPIEWNDTNFRIYKGDVKQNTERAWDVDTRGYPVVALSVPRPNTGVLIDPCTSIIEVCSNGPDLCSNGVFECTHGTYACTNGIDACTNGVDVCSNALAMCSGGNCHINDSPYLHKDNPSLKPSYDLYFLRRNGANTAWVKTAIDTNGTNDFWNSIQKLRVDRHGGIWIFGDAWVTPIGRQPLYKYSADNGASWTSWTEFGETGGYGTRLRSYADPANPNLHHIAWSDPRWDATLGKNIVTQKYRRFRLTCDAEGDVDCNSNNIADECDIFSSTSSDCNTNGVPDECDTDCNTNDVPDECEVAAGTAADCNSNGIPDTCDLSSGTSNDCNSNGIPDECPQVIYDENFEGYSVNDDPAGWFDTESWNSMVESNGLFKVADLNGNKVIQTTNTQTNIHSHYLTCSLDSWSKVLFTGRMRINDVGGGIGVTFMSDYASTDTYHRLRRHKWATKFHFSPSVYGNVPQGDIDTGVIPQANTWYYFEIEISDDGSKTTMKAKVWKEGTSKPSQWQADCYDNGTNANGPPHRDRITSGTFGLWSMSEGTKYWDDLKIEVVP